MADSKKKHFSLSLSLSLSLPNVAVSKKSNGMRSSCVWSYSGSSSLPSCLHLANYFSSVIFSFSFLNNWKKKRREKTVGKNEVTWGGLCDGTKMATNSWSISHRLRSSREKVGQPFKSNKHTHLHPDIHTHTPLCQQSVAQPCQGYFLLFWVERIWPRMTLFEEDFHCIFFSHFPGSLTLWGVTVSQKLYFSPSLFLFFLFSFTTFGNDLHSIVSSIRLCVHSPCGFLLLVLHTR